MNRNHIFNFALLTLIALIPLFSDLAGDRFYTGFFTRILILAISAISLNLLIGFGGMISFGHAAFIGVGGYVVGITTVHAFEDGMNWMQNGYFQVLTAITLSALFSLLIGLIALRTRGIHFIMITLAFSQLLYFTAVGVERYGADDGLSLYDRSDFGDLIDLSNEQTLYYISFASVLFVLLGMNALNHSRFGNVLQGIRLNEDRMKSVGFSVFRFKLVAFVIAGSISGYAGFLLANLTDFISPDMMHWTRSGDLIIMVVLGGIGSLFGPLYGALFFLLLEEVLSSINIQVGTIRIGEYWQLILGPLLLCVVLFARNGLSGLMKKPMKKTRDR